MKLIISLIFLLFQILFVFEGSDLYANWSYFLSFCVVFTIYHENIYTWIKSLYQKNT